MSVPCTPPDEAKDQVFLNGATLRVAEDDLEIQGGVEIVIIDPWPKLVDNALGLGLVSGAA